jgi:hypothetical protein
VTRAYNALLERARSMSTQAAPVPEPLDADEVADKAGTATFTAYVDKTERVLRILRLQAELDAPKGAEGYDTVHVSFLLRLDRVNEDQDIAAPERPQRPEALKRKLEALDLGELGKLVVTGHFQ